MVDVRQMNTDWMVENKKFENVIAKKIGQLGVNKNSYEKKFKLLNIEDMRKQIEGCPLCSKGERCVSHDKQPVPVVDNMEMQPLNFELGNIP